MSGSSTPWTPPFTFDLPFAYSIPPGARHLYVPTPGGTVYVSLGSFGAHFQPLTGHANGDAKANLYGFAAQDETEMVEVAGNGDGIRQAGESWAYDAGPTGDLLRNRVPLYIAPRAGTIDSIRYFSPDTSHFDNPPQWSVHLSMGSGVGISFGHVGRMAPPLRDAVQALTGINTDTYSGVSGTDILFPQSVALAAGDPVAYPSVIASNIPSTTLYTGSFVQIPYAQMECFVSGTVQGQGVNVSIYEYLPPATKTALQAVFDADLADPLSLRYQDKSWGPRWQWASAGRLTMALSAIPADFSDLSTNLGGWFEQVGAGIMQNELFIYSPIAKDVAAYSAANYDSAAVDVLVGRRRNDGFNFSWSLPNGNVSPGAPTGELLQRTATGLLIKWRDLGYSNPSQGNQDVVYQWASCILDPSGLKLRWGAFSDTSAGAVEPALSPADVPNDVDIQTYDHVFLAGF